MLKFRLYPNKTQRQVLEQTLENCRQVYNYLLAGQKATYKETGKLVSQYDQNLKLTQLKSENLTLSKVHSQVLQNISKQVRDAYHNFFVRRRLGFKVGSSKIQKVWKTQVYHVSSKWLQD
jgi:putative transposase